MTKKKPTSVGNLAKLATGAVKRADAWYNQFTGLGNAVMDRLQNHIQAGTVANSPEALNALYHDDPLARKIVTKPVKEAMRLGVDWTTTDEKMDPEERKKWAKAIEAEFERLDLVRKISEAAVWSGVFGCAGVLLGVNDGGIDEPLPPVIRNPVDYAVVLERHSHGFRPYDFYGLDDGDPKVGEPKTYQSHRIGSESGAIYLHESRVIAFGGELTAWVVKQGNGWCDLSILHWCYDALRQYDSSRRSIGLAITDASQVVLKIRGLFEGLMHNSREAIKARLAIVDQAKMSGRVMPIDEEEDYSVHDRAFTGMPDLLGHEKSHLAAVADMPETELWGRGAQGMNATGDGDTRIWYQRLQSDRDNKLGPALDQATFVVAQSIGAPMPETWHVTWPSLWQRDPDQQAAHEKSVAETDAINIQNQVVMPEEVRATRFGQPGEWNDGPVEVDLTNDMEPRDRDVDVHELVASAVEERLLASQPPADVPDTDDDQDDEEE